MKRILSYQRLKQAYYDFMAWSCYGPTWFFHGRPSQEKLAARAKIRDVSELLKGHRSHLKTLLAERHELDRPGGGPRSCSMMEIINMRGKLDQLIVETMLEIEQISNYRRELTKNYAIGVSHTGNFAIGEVAELKTD